MSEKWYESFKTFMCSSLYQPSGSEIYNAGYLSGQAASAAEIKRLREALEKYANKGSWYNMTQANGSNSVFCTNHWACHKGGWELAEAALRPEGEEKP